MQKAIDLSQDSEAPGAPSYEEIVRILTFLVEVADVRAAETNDRDARALLTTLQTSLDAALRLEWASKAFDENGDVLYLD
jgi:D-ribose pyranose/furanose isomerase RbsD